MANVLIESQTMTDIANAIREKSGTTVKMKPAEMPKTIREMKVVDTGVGSRQWWLDVCKEKTYFNYMFSNTSIETIPQLDTSKGTDFSGMFMLCGNLTSIPQIDTSKGNNFNGMFNNCKSLTTIPQLDTSKGTNFYNMFYNCTSLENIYFVAGCIKKSISFVHSPLLSDESIQSIIDGLADLTGQTTQTITFYSTVTQKLIDEQKQTIINKGWKYQ